VPSQAVVGGGGAPGVALPSAAVSLPERLAGPLRSSTAVHNGAHPAVIGRAEGGRLLLDLRAVPPRDDEALANAVIAAAAITAARPTAGPRAAAESQRVAD
jgi:L-seryl-tRNA(Ser) seleniumtransferase